MFDRSPLKSLRRRISRGLSIASEMFSAPSPTKLLRNAMEASDEERALEIYTTKSSNGSSLIEDLNPSASFPSKKEALLNQTPLHLAARKSMYRMLMLLLEHGGNPNISNGRDETVLHAVCGGADVPQVRRELLENLIAWRGGEVDGRPEQISINHVDVDGNAALHYAAANGLLSCVEKLIEERAILSLVNKSQMTCCDVADENHFRELADMLEVSMVFDVEDAAEVEPGPDLPTRPAMLLLDTVSRGLNDLHWLVEDTITEVYYDLVDKCPAEYTLSRERVEALLLAYSWSRSRLLADLTRDPASIFSTARLLPTVPDSGPDPSSLCSICGESMIGEDEAGAGRPALECCGGHRFCVDCWSGHLTVTARDGGHCWACPAFRCSELLRGGDSWISKLLPEELAPRLLEQRARHLVDCSGPLFKWCPVPDCGAVLEFPPPTSPPAPLPLCGLCHHLHAFCLSCGAEAHAPALCDHWRVWQDRVREEVATVAASGPPRGVDDVANALWLAANTKACPRCTAPIEKDEGCNHMSCRKCRHEFCWICMQEWSLHSNNTGGFFQCNRFVTELAAQSGAADHSLYEELGNAQFESLRMKERGGRMARFIPLYTRYRAHADSVAMERRMRRETLARLHRTLSSSLPWLHHDRIPHPFSSGSDPRVDPRVRVIREDNEIDYHPSLGFLQSGFEELVKCRCFLLGGVAYAFTVFEDEEGPGAGRLRSSRLQRSSLRRQDHKTSFDRVQAELERYVEMLSDVLARRRLRASSGQISLVTRLTRAKRLELEELVYMFHLSENLEKEEQGSRGPSPTKASPGQDRSQGLRQRYRGSTASSSSRRSRRSNAESIWEEGDLEGLGDLDIASLASLIAEMTSGSRDGAQGSVSEGRGIDLDEISLREEPRRSRTLAGEEQADLNRAILMSLQDVPQPHPQRPLDEDHLSMLTGMGFSRAEAEEALTFAGHDLDLAVNRLLNSL